MDYERPATATCANCGRTFKVGPIGRVPLFCRPACRTIHFDKNKRGTKVSAEDRQRLSMWELLQDAGVVPADMPPPPKRKPERE
jgi:endogenous inhibitor of DNA gyrase (YacG/DUF329 family)